MPLSKDLREFVALLNSNRVEYLVVGAFAVAFYGVPRYTADLDLLVRATKENANRIVTTLSQFGFGALSLQASDFGILARKWFRNRYRGEEKIKNLSS